MKSLSLALAATLCTFSAAAAQSAAPASPTPGCKVSPAELEANRKVAMGFFRPGATVEDRLALIDAKEYVQHNPVYLKYAREHGTNEHETFRILQSRGAAQPAAGTPRPPSGNMLEIVTAECDLVTIIHRTYRQDPTAPAGTWYEGYAFDTFRVRNGKLVEHWDAAQITPAP